VLTTVTPDDADLQYECSSVLDVATILSVVYLLILRCANTVQQFTLPNTTHSFTVQSPNYSMLCYFYTTLQAETRWQLRCKNSWFYTNYRRHYRCNEI